MKVLFILVGIISCTLLLSGVASAESFKVENPLQSTDFISLIKAVMDFILKIAIPVAVIMILYAGSLFMLARGDTKMIDKGKETLKYAVIGLAIIFIGEGFITLIKSVLSIQ